MASNQPLLDLLTAPRVERVYTDKDTGADQNISVFQAEVKSIPEGAYMVGQVAVPTHTDVIPPSSVILVRPMVPRDDSGDLIMPPIGYEMVWNDKHSGGAQGGSFWRPQAPLGYVALGDVACDGYDPPSTQPNTPAFAVTCCLKERLILQLCGPIKARVLQWMFPSGT